MQLEAWESAPRPSRSRALERVAVAIVAYLESPVTIFDDIRKKVMVTLSKSRIEALSDGVVAIAITLLVLELKVPEVMSHHSDKEMLTALLELRWEFVTYVVTFLIAGAFWY